MHYAQETDADAIRDVESEATTNTEIAPYIRRSDRILEESVRAQRRVGRKWEAEKHDLRGAVWMLDDAREKQQLERVRNLVDNAFVTLPFYRNLYSDVGFEPGDIVSWSDFQKLPVVTKQMMVDAGVGEQVLRSRPGETLHSARTSGSSGLNLTIYQDNASVDYRHLRYMRHCELLLGDVLHPSDWRYGIYFAAERFTSLDGHYPFVTVAQDCPIDVLVQHLAELRPRLILAFPSYLQRLAEADVSLADFGVEAIGSNSERSSAEERVRYSAALGAPVLDEYSSEEMSLIAYECRERRYHLVEDSAYFEVDRPDGDGFGSLVGTSLGNQCMPFIRYDQGDVVKIGANRTQCTCGSRFRLLDGFRGRDDEGLRDGPSRHVPADAVLGLCDRTLVEVASNVQQYQIVQTQTNHVEVRLALTDPKRGTDNTFIASFVRQLPHLFENVTVTVRVIVVNGFETFPSGKRRLIHVAEEVRSA